MKKNFDNIVLAFMLRDMKTRFGRSYIGYLIAIGWPIVHLTIVFVAYVLSHKFAPIGDDPSVFALTGVAPYILCTYPARFTATSVSLNQQLLTFPIVSVLHMIIARTILEALSACLVFIIFFSVMLWVGVAAFPNDVFTSAVTIGSVIFLGVCIGVFGIVLVALHRVAGILFIVFFVLGMYFSSGAIIPLDLLPANLRAMLGYNPLYQAVGLLRSSYFDGMDPNDFSIIYIFVFAGFFLFMGLLGERLVRGRILSG